MRLICLLHWIKFMIFQKPVFSMHPNLLTSWQFFFFINIYYNVEVTLKQHYSTNQEWANIFNAGPKSKKENVQPITIVYASAEYIYIFFCIMIINSTTENHYSRTTLKAGTMEIWSNYLFLPTPGVKPGPHYSNSMLTNFDKCCRLFLFPSNKLWHTISTNL